MADEEDKFLKDQMYRYQPPFKKDGGVDIEKITMTLKRLETDCIDPDELMAIYRHEKKKERKQEKAEKAKKSGSKKHESGKADKIKSENKERLDVKEADSEVVQMTKLGDCSEMKTKTATGNVAKYILSLARFWAAEDKGAVLDAWLDLQVELDTLKKICRGEEEDFHGGKVVASAGKNMLSKLFEDHRGTLKKISQWVAELEEKKEIETYQLQNMGNRLYPLSFDNFCNRKLDEWQMECIQNLQRGDSVLVCAPTSSGKTVLSLCLLAKQGGEEEDDDDDEASQYTKKKPKAKEASEVKFEEKRILFVVPSPALALQVAAMFAPKVKGPVSILCEQLDFGDFKEKSKLIVGTPMVLETELFSCKPEDITTIVIDEIHNLSKDPCMERLLLMLPKARVLGLSATVGNAEWLHQWMRSLRPDPHRTHLVQVPTRFFNLQHQIYNISRRAITEVSPLAAVDGTAEQEKANDRKKKGKDPAFTPFDVHHLWSLLKDDLPANLQPTARLPELVERDAKTNKSRRIALSHAREYGRDLMKFLSGKDEAYRQSILKQLALADDSAGFVGAEAPPVTSYIYELVRSLQGKMPLMCFSLDPAVCYQACKALVVALENAEEVAHPNFRSELAKEWAQYQTAKDQYNDRLDRLDNETARIAYQQDNPAPQPPMQDLEAPHPQFCVVPGQPLGSSLFEDLEEELRVTISKRRTAKLLKEHEEEFQYYFKALRRGIGLYTQHMPVGYLRFVQQLAQQRRLGVIFSDKSLSHGINMPIQTAVFMNDHPGLTPLMAQQMMGRAGRRGMDRSGNVVFAGLTPARVRELMQGEVPPVVGTDIDIPAVCAMPTADKKMILFNIFKKSLRNFQDPIDDAETNRRIAAATALYSKIPATERALLWRLRMYKEAFQLCGVVVPELMKRAELHAPVHIITEKDSWGKPYIKKMFDDNSLAQVLLKYIVEGTDNLPATSNWDQLESKWASLEAAIDEGLRASGIEPTRNDRSGVYDVFKLNSLPKDTSAGSAALYNYKQAMWNACDIMLHIRNTHIFADETEESQHSAEHMLRSAYQRLFYLLLESPF